ncbi:MAG: RNA polymerase sigma factor [Limisphaerales bacterium]
MPVSNDMASPPDEELVKASKGGDMAAFEELVARHRDKIFGRAFRIVRQEEEAMDLSQEAWIKGWQRIGQFEGESSFATWMTRITINLCLDHIRRNQRYRVDPLPDQSDDGTGIDRFLPPVWTNPTERLERSELRARIDAALGKLSDAHRTVLVLHEFEDLGYKEIASAIGISIGTVMSRLFYARRRMAALLAGFQDEEKSSPS